MIGAATDYSSLYTARYLEELRRHESRTEATRAALRGVLEPILTSGGTVIAGLLCLLFSDLGSNRSLEPVAAIGVAFVVLASLTLLPSLTHLLGRASYWPRMPRFDPDRTDEGQTPRCVRERFQASLCRVDCLRHLDGHRRRLRFHPQSRRSSHQQLRTGIFQRPNRPGRVGAATSRVGPARPPMS